MLLAKEQRIGAAVLCLIALVIWFIHAISPSQAPAPEPPVKPTHDKRTATRHKFDSILREDSLRYQQWTAIRKHRYDSFRITDSVQRMEWRKERIRLRDSLRREDSLWMDSVGIPYFLPRLKKDTILDLNHCDTSELILIRGIGRYTAVQIVQYRERLGGFYSPSQLTDELFSKLSLDTLLYHFIVDTTAIRPININTCSVDSMVRHPYIRYEQAKAIYNLRRKIIRITSLEDLRSLPQLTDDDIRRLAAYISLE